MYITEEISQLTHQDLVSLLFAYSNYVMEQIEEQKQPCCVSEYYQHDYEMEV